MSKIRITGELHGDTKTITVNAADEVEAINKIKAKYPDFEVASMKDHAAANGASFWSNKSPKEAANDNDPIVLLQRIEKNTRVTAKLAKIVLVVLAIILAVFVFCFALGMGYGLGGG